MRCRLTYVGTIFLFLTSLAWSNDPYYNQSFLGESNIEQYVGPHAPDINVRGHRGKSSFKDDDYYQKFMGTFIEDDFLSLESFWSDEVGKMNSCPNFYLNENIEYIRYLYRLITASYLFESMKEHASLSHRLGFSDNTCSLDWNYIFSKCRARSLNMKRFIKRTKPRYLISYDTRRLVTLNRAQRGEWLKKDLKKIMSTPQGIVDYRIRLGCRGEKSKKCHDLKQLEAIVKKSCAQDRNFIELICSEKDHLYGVSWAPLATKILASSNVMRNLNKGGFASACLERYGQIHKEDEMAYRHLKELFNYVYQKYKEEKGSDHVVRIEGELFLPGALKEFDDRGLQDFLFVKPKKVAKKPKPAPVMKKPVVPAAKPKPKPVVVKKVVVKKKPVVKPKPKPLSSFEKTVKSLSDSGKKHKAVEMTSFLSEFPFQERVLKALEAPLADYQTRTALVDMLRYDKLGSKYEPVRLQFIKYLISLEKHAGLWNVVSVLGHDFYVVNDIEKKSTPVPIHLENSEKTNHIWQITVLSEKEFLAKKKGAKK